MIENVTDLSLFDVAVNFPEPSLTDLGKIFNVQLLRFATGSISSVTITSTSRDELFEPAVACIVKLYLLSFPLSLGDSKSGASIKLN